MVALTQLDVAAVATDPAQGVHPFILLLPFDQVVRAVDHSGLPSVARLFAAPDQSVYLRSRPDEATLRRFEPAGPDDCPGCGGHSSLRQARVRLDNCGHS